MFIHDLGNCIVLTVKLVSKGVAQRPMVIHAHVMKPVRVMILWGLPNPSSGLFFKANSTG